MKKILPRIFSILLCGLAPIAYPSECDIKGFEFVSAAASAGWSIEVTKANGDGACTVISPVVLISGATQGTNLTCEITYFKNKALLNGWKISKLLFSGADFSILQKPDWPNNSAETVISISILINQTKTLGISKIMLTSPSEDCTNWKSAL